LLESGLWVPTFYHPSQYLNQILGPAGSSYRDSILGPAQFSQNTQVHKNSSEKYDKNALNNDKAR